RHVLVGARPAVGRVPEAAAVESRPLLGDVVRAVPAVLLLARHPQRVALADQDLAGVAPATADPHRDVAPQPISGMAARVPRAQAQAPVRLPDQLLEP